MITSILCPVDFSEHSERALRYALDLAALTKARVTLLAVTHPLLDAAVHTAGTRNQTRQDLQALADRAATGAGTAIALSVKVGHAAEEIIKAAAEGPTDLIVMGTQGLGAAERLVLGSTTEQVLRESAVPVLAVPPPRSA